MKRAAIYVRVSTGKQAAGELSIPDQIRQCEAYAEKNGYEIVKVYTDAGVSARTDKRPQFQEMISRAVGPDHPFDAILVHSQSRLFRNTKDLLVYRSLLDERQVRFISITQDLGEGEAADILTTMVGAFDEYQSKETAKHVSRSMIENAKQGFWNGATAPFGFRTYAAETRGARIKKKIEIDPEEAETVRLVFGLYVRGDGTSGPMGVKRIANYLNEQGFVTRQGKPFRIQFIDKILRNTAYIGEHYFNRTDSRRKIPRAREEWVSFPMPRIVEDVLFYEAQEKLDRQHPMKTAPRLTSSDILLTTLAVCEECGAPMRKLSGKSGQYHYYRCSKKADAGQTACKGVSIPMQELDDIVINALEGSILRPKRLRKMTEMLLARAHERGRSANERRKQLDGEKRKAEAQVTNLYTMVGSGELTMDGTLSTHIREHQDKIGRLKRQIALLDRERRAPVDKLSCEAVEKFGDTVSKALRNPDNRQFAKAYVQTLISKIEVGEKQIKISGPNDAIAHQAMSFAASGELVPAFAQEWRT